jgi:hypothetical protein
MGIGIGLFVLLVFILAIIFDNGPSPEGFAFRSRGMK